jgi:hypothetical protein
MKFILVWFLVSFSLSILYMNCSSPVQLQLRPNEGLSIAFKVYADPEMRVFAEAKFYKEGRAIKMPPGAQVSCNGLKLKEILDQGYPLYKVSNLIYAEEGSYNFIYKSPEGVITRSVVTMPPRVAKKIKSDDRVRVSWNPKEVGEDLFNVRLRLKEYGQEDYFETLDCKSADSGHCEFKSKIPMPKGVVEAIRTRRGKMADSLHGSIFASQTDTKEIELTE